MTKDDGIVRKTGEKSEGPTSVPASSCHNTFGEQGGSSLENKNPVSGSDVKAQSTSKRRSDFLDPKANLKVLGRTLVIVVVTFVVLAFGGPISVCAIKMMDKAMVLYRKVTHQPVTLVDAMIDVPSKSMRICEFVLTSAADVTVDIEVVHGHEVDVYVLGSEGMEKLNRTSSGLLHSGQIPHYVPFHSANAKKAMKVGRLDPGNYYVVIRNNTWGILVSSEFAVRVKVTVL